MDLNDEANAKAFEDMLASFARQGTRLRELETWLALLIMRHGQPTELGHRYELTVEECFRLRDLLPPRLRVDPRVIISTDEAYGVVSLDAL